MVIHSTAVVSAEARIGEGVEIGPYCVVGPKVKLGRGSRLISHVSLQGPSTFGENNIFHPFCSLGGKTQDLKYQGEPTYLTVGDSNEFREHVTINRGTGIDEETVIGSYNLFLAYSHVAHNCRVGNHCILSNNGTLGGHVTLEDWAIIGGLSAVHQFCRIGEHAMVGGCAKIVQDVPPFFIADGNPAEVRAINTVGLQRRGFSEERLRAIRSAYKKIYGNGLNTSQALEALMDEFGDVADIQTLVQFIKNSERGIIR